MTEILILNYFLFVAFILAPLMIKNFFLKGSKVYSDGHKISLIILLFGVLLNLNYLVIVWPLFCAWGFFLYLKNEHKLIFSVNGLAGCIPFIFSLISSVWFVAGVFDLHLLGYNKAWSFYAALHGSFLGWIFVGCLAFLSKKTNSNRIYLWGGYLSFLFFLLVAFGIDGVPYIKRIGLVGFSLMTPFLIGHYAFNLKKENKLSIFLSLLSLFSIISSMILAVLNEFWVGFPRVVFDVPIMVSTHGFVNALFAIPCFFLAIRLERDECSSKPRVSESVVFFDDLCVLCSGSVILLTQIDKKRKFKYSSLRGKFAQTLPNLAHVRSVESVIFWSEGVIYDRAEAVIHILIKLGGIYKFIGVALKIFPRVILDLFYDFIARNRYRLFGKNDACLIPADEIKDLFIS